MTSDLVRIQFDIPAKEYEENYAKYIGNRGVEICVEFPFENNHHIFHDAPPSTCSEPPSVNIIKESSSDSFSG